MGRALDGRGLEAHLFRHCIVVDRDVAVIDLCGEHLLRRPPRPSERCAVIGDRRVESTCSHDGFSFPHWLRREYGRFTYRREAAHAGGVLAARSHGARSATVEMVRQRASLSPPARLRIAAAPPHPDWFAIRPLPAQRGYSDIRKGGHFLVSLTAHAGESGPVVAPSAVAPWATRRHGHRPRC
jgi:hypothetical protein